VLAADRADVQANPADYLNPLTQLLWPGSRAGEVIAAVVATLAMIYGFYLGSFPGAPQQEAAILYGWLAPEPSSIQWASGRPVPRDEG
jgi:hypothetical protein